jgi:hypothetical protein
MCPVAKAAELGTAVAALEAKAAVYESVAGASYIGITDTATQYVATDVEGALAEVKAIADTATQAADLASNDNAKGASLVGIEDAGALFAATDVEAALAEVKAVADAGIGAVKRTVTIGFADFAALGVADFTAIDVGAALPANARLLGYEIVDVTPFDDGGASVDVKIRIGVGVETSAIMGDVDIDQAAAPIASTNGTPGARGYPMHNLGGETVIATVTTTNPAHLAGLDAGAVTVNLFYCVLA